MKKMFRFFMIALVTGTVAVHSTGCNGGEETPPEEVKILKLEPSSGIEGEEISIKGSGFGEGIEVYFADQKKAEVVNVAKAIVKVKVPAGAVTGKVTVKMSHNREAESSEEFTVTPSPSITGVAPTSVKLGDEIVITGHNFTENVKVYTTGDVEATITEQSATEITAVVQGGSDGPVIVKLGGFSTSSTQSLTIDKTPVISFCPVGVSKGGELAIQGLFSSDADEIEVSLNGSAVTPKSVELRKIVIQVPSTLAEDAELTVKVTNKSVNKTSGEVKSTVFTFFDDFDRANVTDFVSSQNSSYPFGSGWQVADGATWHMVNGMLEAENTAAAGWMAMLINEDLVTDGQFVIQVDAQMRSEGVDNWAGFLTNYIDKDNYYMFRFCGPRAAFLYMEEGTFDDAGYDGVPIEQGKMVGNTWYRFRMATTSNTRHYTLSITKISDGSEVFSGTIKDDKSQGTLIGNKGYFGFYFGNFGQFDNVGFTKK